MLANDTFATRVAYQKAVSEAGLQLKGYIPEPVGIVRDNVQTHGLQDVYAVINIGLYECSVALVQVINEVS